VRNDPTGRIARDWLAGRNLSKGAKLAGREFWDFLSGPVHANSRAVLDWLAISQCDGVTRVRLGPERRPDMANAALTVMAAEGRDIANLLAIECDISVDLRGLDAALALATARYIPEDEQLDE
jgi:hypothetical protein